MLPLFWLSIRSNRSDIRLAGGMGALAPVIAHAEETPPGPETGAVIAILKGKCCAGHRVNPWFDKMTPP